jgi:multifunctional methyltransferase subunit TRM112
MTVIDDRKMVRLITHNLLACHAKGCTSNNFPLQLKDVQVALREADFNSDFIRGFLSKIEWDALVNAARQVPLAAPYLNSAPVLTIHS